MPSRRLAATLLARYLFFLHRRPISGSNVHYLARRLAGLRSLAAELEGDPDPEVSRAAVRLLRLTPGNLDRLAPAVVAGLMEAVPKRPPEDFVVTRSAPGASFVRPSGRILLVLGPGVGVGDEILSFPLPLWIGGGEEARVTVLSAYRGLWDRVLGVERVEFYERHSELMNALTGAGRWAEFDLVALVDFESPGLAPSICRGSSRRPYLEIGLGERKATVVDMARRRVHRMPSPDPYCANFYRALAHIGRWLGLSTVPDRRAGLVTITRRPPTDRRVVVVCPFSSKYDPSALYWSRLLATVLVDAPAATTVLFDPGPNRETEGFARALARGLPIRLGSRLRCEVIRPTGERSVSLGRMMEIFAEAHVVITADSYAAHAAPVFGCATLVLASEKVENWRVPGGPAFYFAADAEMLQIASAMKRVLAALWGTGDREPSGDPRRTEQGRRLDAESGRIASLLASGAPLGPLLGAWEGWASVFRALLATGEEWRPASEALFEDAVYERLLAPAPEPLRTVAGDAGSEGSDGETAGLVDALELHLRDGFERWDNTNLRKFLALPVVGEAL